jgi:hypothetical protein
MLNDGGGTMTGQGPRMLRGYPDVTWRTFRRRTWILAGLLPATNRVHGCGAAAHNGFLPWSCADTALLVLVPFDGCRLSEDDCRAVVCIRRLRCGWLRPFGRGFLYWP